MPRCVVLAVLICLGGGCDHREGLGALKSRVTRQAREIATLTERLKAVEGEPGKGSDPARSEYQESVAIVDRLNALAHAIGTDTDDDKDGKVTVDHEHSRVIEQGYPADVIKAIGRRFATGELGFGEFDGSWWTAAQPEKKAQAMQAWDLVESLFGQRWKSDGDNDLWLDPTFFVFATDESTSMKTDSRRRISQRFRSELQYLAPPYRAQAAPHFERIAAYVESLNRKVAGPPASADAVHLGLPVGDVR
jgi:hypothetical protein